jgi:hypothetical protein
MVAVSLSRTEPRGPELTTLPLSPELSERDEQLASCCADPA